MKAGYYRYKISDLTPGTYTYNWYVNGNLAGTSCVIVRDHCEESKYLKFIDTNGFYKFFSFNERWQQTDIPTQIGVTNNLITSLKDAQSNVNNIGYKTNRTMTLVAENVSEDELNIIGDIFTSPSVYLQVGPDKEDWVLVTLVGDGISRRKRNEFGKITLTITLPEHYGITSY